ncbi:MAG: hypothetical protein DME42_08345 [Verrucomicrobia bacterium]|nr:MAG: hypothetical protein DME42_08345 [Verrucomicrobiota bacterium]
MLNPMPSGQTDTPQIRLVAGLGNPGPEYAGTRHNIGFVALDHLAAQFGSTWEKSTKWEALTSRHGELLLAKPMSSMNRSGYPLVAIAQFYNRRGNRRTQRTGFSYHAIRNRRNSTVANRDWRRTGCRLSRLCAWSLF